MLASTRGPSDKSRLGRNYQQHRLGKEREHDHEVARTEVPGQPLDQRGVHGLSRRRDLPEQIAQEQAGGRERQ